MSLVAGSTGFRSLSSLAACSLSFFQSEEDKLLIIGAGLTGMLAAHFFRHHSPVVLEMLPSLPDNHGAILRFRSDDVMRITGAPLRKVLVRKAVLCADGSLSDCVTLTQANQYSMKVIGMFTDRSIFNLAPVERWVAEPDFVAQMAKGLDIKYDFGVPLDIAHLQKMNPKLASPILSTAPMHQWLCELPDWHFMSGNFQARAITTIEQRFNKMDLHQTLYCPEFEYNFDVLPDMRRVYRASFTGDRLIVEMMYLGGANIENGDINEATELALRIARRICGQVPEPAMQPFIRTQRYGKIVALPDEIRRGIITDLTDKFNIYSVGRFATWRQILLDDVVHDLEVVKGLLNRGEYARRTHYASK